jgi:hypothetical protein
LISSERHHGTRNLRDQLVVVSKNVADVTANLSSYIHRFSDRTNATIPYRTKEIDLQIDTGETFAFLETRGVSRPNRGVSNVAQNAAMNCAHGICVPFRVRNDFYRRRARADFYQLKAKRLGYGGRIDETGFRGRSFAVSGHECEKLQIR